MHWVSSWFFAVWWALAAAPNASNVELSAQAVAEDVALAQEAYERIHPGYDRYTSAEELANAWSAIKRDAEAAGTMTQGTLYLRVQEVLAQIRCDHTKAELSRAQVQRRNSEPLYLPFRWEVVQRRAFVVASPNPQLRSRDEILAIDGTPMAELIDRYIPLVPVDGYTDEVRTGELGASSEFRGGVIEHFAIETTDVAERATVRMRSPGGEPRMVEVTRVTFDEWKAIRQKDEPYQLNFADPRAVTLRRIGDDAAYLSVDTFVNYRKPIRPDRVYDPVFRALRREDRRTLILDLRRNGGGSGDAQRRLYAHLVDRPARLVRDVRNKTLSLDGLRDHLWTWDKRALRPRRIWFRKNDDGTYSLRTWLNRAVWKVRPDRLAFDGKLIVLTSRDNSSAVSTLLAKLRERPNTTLVGEPTGGSAEGVTANILLFLTLPNSKIVTRVPAQRIYNDVTSFEPGMGVPPDVLIRRTPQDVLEGRDRALQKAFELAGVQ